MLIDTHTHIYADAFDEDRGEAIARAIAAGVSHLILPAIDSKTTAIMHEVKRNYPEYVSLMMGLHPTHVGLNVEEELAHVKEQLDAHSFVAVGEIGMDLYWDKTYQRQQQDAFARQIDWALAADLPIVIHCRDAFTPVFDVLEGFNDPRLRGVFHCFTGTKADAQRALDLNFYLGIGGVITFKNGKIDQFLADFPIEKMLLETDSPYLAPTPYRGKRNESAYLSIIAKKMAELFGTTTAEVARITSKNAQQLFDLS
ncbi:MAG: TatD family hydrolase [Flavobacteriaceae bacterium]|nr:TatD family hydrolase [Flavobacteriaceae bacterium]